MSALLRNRPDLSREKLERTRMLMDQHATDALVTGYEDLIPGLNLPDPNDWHRLAAAIRGRADDTSTQYIPTVRAYEGNRDSGYNDNARRGVDIYRTRRRDRRGFSVSVGAVMILSETVDKL